MVAAAAITFITDGAITGAAATLVAGLADIVINFGPPPSPMAGRISGAVMTRQPRRVGIRPPGGIRPHEREQIADGARLRFWDGYDGESQALIGGVGSGTCLEPDFKANEMLLFDRSLQPRTGDVVLVEEIIDHSPYRAAKVYERTDDGPGLIYCNDPGSPWRLYLANVKGRLVLAISLPEGISWQEVGAELRKRPDVAAALRERQ